jgi:hypothetical protein
MQSSTMFPELVRKSGFLILSILAWLMMWCIWVSQVSPQIWQTPVTSTPYLFFAAMDVGLCGGGS